MQLRDYQNLAISNIRKSYEAGNKNVLLTLPTGAGKTVIFSEITRLAGLKGANVLILVHRKELIDQAGDKLTKANVKYGIIAAGHKESKSNVQVASVQTLINRLNNPNQFDLIIIDSPPLLGLSDSVIISEFVDSVVLTISLKKVKRYLVQEARKKIDMTNSNFIGVVVNNVEQTKDKINSKDPQ